MQPMFHKTTTEMWILFFTSTFLLFSEGHVVEAEYGTCQN